MRKQAIKKRRRSQVAKALRMAAREAADFEPTKFEDHYETALVELIKEKQAGKVISKGPARAAAPPQGNVIDLLKRSLEIEGKRSKKAPPLQPDMPKAKAKRRQRA